MARSIAAAVFVYGGASAGVVAATATAKLVAVDEHEVAVVFRPPPPPPPAPAPVLPKVEPPPIAAPAPSPRPKVHRRELIAPKEVPKEKLVESDQPLVASDESGPLDGFLDGVEGGQGVVAAPPPPPPPAPPPPPPRPIPAKPEPLIPAVAISGNAAPRYSASARRRGIEGVVVVTFDILEDGRVANVRIVSGPDDLRDSVLNAVTGWRFQPARRGNKPVPMRKTQSIRFRLDDA